MTHSYKCTIRYFQSALVMDGALQRPSATGTFEKQSLAKAQSMLSVRIVHFPESFWAARNWCESMRGRLLSLDNVGQVLEAVGDSMHGNAAEYRIDGWAEGQWYQK